MESIICKECGKIFEYEKMSSCKAQLKKHIREAHKMSIIDYVVKHEYGGVRPVCPCGCGHELNLSQNGDRWKFTKYYSDTCYGRLVRACNDEVLKHYKDTHKNDFDIVKYYEAHYDRESFEKAYEMLKSKNFSLTDISKSYNIDKRTLKKVWLAMGISNPAELAELLEYTKYNLSSINKPTNTINDEDVIVWTYSMLKTHPGKYTAHSLGDLYNKSHKDSPTTKKGETIAKSLYKVYGDEIDMYLAKGFHSSEEYEFFNILSFYTDYSCRMGKKFILNDGSYVFFDIVVGSRLLIEYDSEGKYHTSEQEKEKDALKENFAKENGYKFLRLNKTDIKKIETIQLIKELLQDETGRD